MVKGVKEDKKTLAGHVYDQDMVKIQPYKSVMLRVEATEHHNTIELVHHKSAGNDFPFCFKVTEGKQIIVSYVNNSRINNNVKKHSWQIMSM